jgi:carbamoyl-phosphate synthase large subunit
MPKRNDLYKILVLGAGPVVVGQGMEFDYAGVQACRALKEVGYEVIVVNSNPATAMTDPASADRIYIEPLTPVNLEKIISKEKPDALLLNYGGQAAFDLGNHLVKSGCLAKYELKLIGMGKEILNGAGRYQYYQEKLAAYQVKIPAGSIVKDIKEGMKLGIEMGFPIAFRVFNAPAGTAIAYNQEELEDLLQIELSKTPDEPVLLEESMLGWKEFAFEVLGDGAGKYLMVGSLEKLMPMGVHYEDSVAVTPVQSLSTGEYQEVAAICENVARAIQLTGRINIQVAQNPVSGEFYVFSINYGVTKSMAMIAKAIDLPIADIATRLMVGYQLEEIIPGFEQHQADYVAVKLPRFDLEKFPTADFRLDTAMKSTGEAMAIGANFKAALQKGLRSLENECPGFGADGQDQTELKASLQDVKERLSNPNPESIFYLRYGLKLGLSTAELNRLTKIDPYFLNELADLVSLEKNLTTYALYNLTPEIFLKAKQWGFSDAQLAYLLRSTETQVREAREKIGIYPVFATIPSGKRVNQNEICAKPAPAGYYSFYQQTERGPVDSKNVSVSDQEKQGKIIIIGPGPNRIERGGEFDYSLVHASLALQEAGYETLIVNNNPSALSTDWCYSDKHYWEPTAGEELRDIIRHEKPMGAILQFAGQPAEMVPLFEQMKVPVLDQSILNIAGPIEPGLFKSYAQEFKISRLPMDEASDTKNASEVCNQIGYPVIIRSPGSRPAEIAFDAGDLGDYFQRITVACREGQPTVFLEKLIEEGIGVEVTCVTDGDAVIICAIMEQIEEAAINANDSALALPPYSLGEAILANIKAYSKRLILELKTKGLVNLQYIIKHHTIYLRTVNRPVTRLIPVLIKATGINWIEIAMKVTMGQSLKELGLETDPVWRYSIVKEAVFSFERFPGVDTILGPETRSTGEVMGLAKDFGLAFIKSQLAAGEKLPVAGTIFLSIKDEDKRAFIPIIKQLVNLGFKIFTTEDIAAVLERNSIPCRPVKKIGEGRPNILDHIKNGMVQWIFNTPAGRKARREESLIRSTAVARGIPIVTTVAAAQAVVTGIENYLEGKMEPVEVREFYGS